MASTTALSGSFRAPTTGVIRLTRSDTLATVDWTVTEGDTWLSADLVVAAWTAVVVADVGFGSAWSITAARGATVLATTITGAGWLVTWQQSGDTRAIRDWLGGTGASDTGGSGGTVGDIPASFVCGHAAIEPYRSSTGRTRGHTVAVDGTTQTQHATSTGDADDAMMSATLQIGNGSAVMADHHDAWEDWITNLYGMSGGGEPWSISITYETGTTEAWVVRFGSDTFDVRPTMPTESVPRTHWLIILPSLMVVSAPW